MREHTSVPFIVFDFFFRPPVFPRPFLVEDFFDIFAAF